MKIATAAVLAVLISAGLLFSAGCGDIESDATPVALAPTAAPAAEPTAAVEPTATATAVPSPLEPTATAIPVFFPESTATATPQETPTPASLPSATVADNNTQIGGGKDGEAENGPTPIPMSEIDEAELMRALFNSPDDGVVPDELADCIDKNWTVVSYEYDSSADEAARMSALNVAVQEFEGASSYRTLMNMSTVFKSSEGDYLNQITSVVALCWDYGNGASAFTPDSDVTGGEAAVGVVATAVEDVQFFTFPFVTVDGVVYGFNPLDGVWEISGGGDDGNVTPKIGDAMPQIARVFAEGETRDDVGIAGGAAEYMGESVWAYEATGVSSDAIPSLAEYSEGEHRVLLLVGIKDESIKYIEIESNAKNPCAGPSAPAICAVGDSQFDDEIDGVFVMRIRIENLGVPFRAVIPPVE